MTYDPNNVFAKILDGQLPCAKVYEDDHTFVFMDIMPQNDGHTLVIPKEPATDLLSLSDESAQSLAIMVKKVAIAVKAAMQADGITIFQLNGAAAGQTVPHIHFHVLPGSILNARSHSSEQADPQQLQQYAEQISAELEKVLA